MGRRGRIPPHSSKLPSCFFRLDPTPLVVGNQIVTTYSALGNTGIKMAITALPP